MNVLYDFDLLDLIARKAPIPSLLCLALTCKGFTEVSLAILWSRPPTSIVLFKLFSSFKYFRTKRIWVGLFLSFQIKN